MKSLLLILGSAVVLLSGHRLDAAPKMTFLLGDYLASEGGTWKSEDSPLRQPFGIDFDSSGNFYLVELERGGVFRMEPSGQLKTLLAPHPKGYQGDGGPLSEARLNGPHNCVVDARDQLLISDSWNHVVRAVDLRDLTIRTIAGTGQSGFSGDGGPGSKAVFNYTMCIALAPNTGHLLIADLKNLRIREVDAQSGQVRTLAGNGKKGVPTDGARATEAPLVDPRAVAADNQGQIYILERNGNALRVVRTDGTIQTVAGTGEKGHADGPALQARFGSPKHICCDPQGRVYIADDLNGAIRRYDPATGRVSTLLGRGHGDSRLTLSHPHGVRWHQGALYLTDTGNHRLIRLELEGN